MKKTWLTAAFLALSIPCWAKSSTGGIKLTGTAGTGKAPKTVSAKTVTTRYNAAIKAVTKISTDSLKAQTALTKAFMVQQGLTPYQASKLALEAQQLTIIWALANSVAVY